MKLSLLRGCKTLVVIIFFIILFIYYHNLFKTYIHFHQRSNGTDSTATDELNTENDATTAKRIKRFLIFEGGGVVKIVFGTSFPIIMADEKRSLNYFYNFQIQYTPPAIPFHWWSIYNTTTFAARKHSMEKLMQFDESRDRVYKFIKRALKSGGNPDNECLLNAICELARAPFLDGFRIKQENYANQVEDDYGREIYHKIINAIFRPVHSNFEKDLLNARIAGENGANCDKTFGKCPIVEKWLKKFTHFI